MNLLAFKALEKSGDTLCSPQFVAIWRKKYIPQMGGEYFFLDSDRRIDFEDCNGIHAATFEEALRYGKDIYLVAPLPSPDTAIVLGTAGWRASAAIVVGGPYSIDIKSRLSAAEKVLAAAQMGYETIPEVLIEAISIYGQADAPLPEGIANGASSIDLLASLAIGKSIPPFLDNMDKRAKRKAVAELAKVCAVIDENGGDFLNRLPQDCNLMGDLIKAFYNIQYRTSYVLGAILDRLDMTKVIKHLIEVERFDIIRLVFDSLVFCSLPKEKILAMMEAALSSNDRLVTKAIIMECHRMASADTLPILERIAKSIDGDRLLLSNLVEACGAVGAESIPLLEYLLETKEVDLRIEVVNACKEIGKKSLCLLERIASASAKEAKIISAIFSACTKIGEPSYGLIRKLIEDNDWLSFDVLVFMIDSWRPDVELVKSIMTKHPEYYRSLNLARAEELDNMIKEKPREQAL